MRLVLALLVTRLLDRLAWIKHGIVPRSRRFEADAACMRAQLEGFPAEAEHLVGQSPGAVCSPPGAHGDAGIG